jgi:hypothetical protein
VCDEGFDTCPGGPSGVPSLSFWGTLAMGLLLLGAGTHVFAGARPVAGEAGVAIGAGIGPVSLRPVAAFTVVAVLCAALARAAGALDTADAVGVGVCAPLAFYLILAWRALRD